MSDQKYRPQTAETEALMEQIKTLTPAQTNGLAKASKPGFALYRARDLVLLYNSPWKRLMEERV